MILRVAIAFLLMGAAANGAASCSAAEKGRVPAGEAEARLEMVRLIEARGVEDEAVLEAMRRVPRHLFVPATLRDLAYDDSPLPIGDGQTISQPYIVALMTELARVRPGARVLEIGTGSGYQAAVLAQMKAEIYTIEIIAALADRARATIEAAGYPGLHYRVGDGYRGWQEAAPFDAVIVTAAPDHVPQPLIDQLAVGGRLVIPVGGGAQSLLLITRTAEGVDRKEILPVRFVPMTGEAQQPPP